MNYIPSPADLAAATEKARLAVRAKRIQAARPPRKGEVFAVGGGCGGNCNRDCIDLDGNPIASMNQCYHDLAKRAGCRMTVVSGGQTAVSGAFSFPVVPDTSNYFLPIAVRLYASVDTNPLAEAPARLTSVVVNSTPQETYNQATPTAAYVGGVDFRSYGAKTGAGEGNGIPAWEVAWSPFARDSQVEQLRLIGLSLEPDGNPITVRAEIWGYPINNLPDDMSCGNHPGCKPRTPTPQ